MDDMLTWPWFDRALRAAGRIISASAILTVATACSMPSLEMPSFTKSDRQTVALPVRFKSAVVTEPNSPRTAEDVAYEVSDLAARCWLGVDPRFAGYSAAGPLPKDTGFQIQLRSRTSGQPRPEFIIGVEPGQSGLGYTIYVSRIRQNGLPQEKISADLRKIRSGQFTCG